MSPAGRRPAHRYCSIQKAASSPPPPATPGQEAALQGRGLLHGRGLLQGGVLLHGRRLLHYRGPVQGRGLLPALSTYSSEGCWCPQKILMLRMVTIMHAAMPMEFFIISAPEALANCQIEWTDRRTDGQSNL